MKKKLLPIFAACGLVIVLITCIAIVFLVKKYAPSKERQSLKDYYEISADDQIPIILNDKIDTNARLIDDQLYLDYTFVHDNLNSRFYWDSNENILLYTTASSVISASVDATQYQVSKSTEDFGQVIVKADAKTAWIHIDYVKKYSDLTYTYITDSVPRIVMHNKWGEIQTASTKKSTKIRVKGGIKSPILADLEKNTKLTILEEGDDWDKAVTEDGIIGYVQKKRLSAVTSTTRSNDFEEEEFHHFLKDEKICMAWHQVTNQAANDDIANILASTKGINVISPTWFYLNDNNGNLADLASKQYIKYCHNQNIEVWALFSNLENNDVDTSYVLTHTSTRQNLVNQIVSAAIQYNLDGVNLDFEAIKPEVGDAYIQFVRELSIKLENNEIVLSVDNYVPTAYTAFYDRAEQANYADYVVIMGYDEHTSTSEQEGSVASLGWVKEGVENTLKEVPAEQTILAMPFYTRIWTLTPADPESDTDSGDYTISSKAYGMKVSWDIMNGNNADIFWDEDSGQYFGMYTKDDIIYESWLENSESMDERLRVMDEHKLAGVSFWKLGFETDDIWNTVIKYIN